MNSGNWEYRLGDVREVLKGIEDQTVQCCITSPPYWGLRDYGTASWEGGDPECEHKREHFGKNPSKKQLSNAGSANGHSRLVYRDVCGKCGALRRDLQIGLEPTPEQYVQNLVDIFREVKRVLRDDGTLWLNIGDSYAGSGVHSADHANPGLSKAGIRGADVPVPVPEGLKPKDLVGIPWMVAFALRGDGWYLRNDIVWSKTSCMPEPVKDRCTRSHEYLFHFAKSKAYFYDIDAIREPHKTEGWESKERTTRPNFDGINVKGLQSGESYHPMGRNKRTVWTINPKPFPEAHFAVFPEALVEPCVLAGTSQKACPKCGAPWKRVVEMGSVITTGGSSKGMRAKIEWRGEVTEEKQNHSMFTGDMVAREHKTVGWQPTCECKNDGSGRCIVLDPFAGSGTTLVVARKLGRSAIGIDINDKYKQIFEKRMEGIAGNIENLCIRETVDELWG
jgi:DNA modification methylase